MQKQAMLLVATALFGAVSCKVSASANLKAGGEGKTDEVDFNEPIDDTDVDGFAGDLPPQDPALLGVRQDLALTGPKAKQANCACLAAAVGTPNDPSFAWQSKAPQIDVTRQLVVALGSDEVSCGDAAAADKLASYWGYRTRGDDVVVYVEVAKQGRPVPRGAIIPKPLGNGQVYVGPVSKDVPFGKSLDPKEPLCKLGNPGAVRTVADDPPEGEIGSSPR